MKAILLIAAGFLVTALGGCVVVPEPVHVSPPKKFQHYHHHHRPRWRRR